MIPHQSLEEALTTADKFGVVLGTESYLLPNSFTLSLPVDKIDDAMIAEMQREEAEAIYQSIPTPYTRLSAPVRIDRTIEPDSEQLLQILEIEAEFLELWTAASENRLDQRSALDAKRRQKHSLRLSIIEQVVRLDVTPGETLVYGLPDVPEAICIPEANGVGYDLTTLIHASHPASPEDLYLRECRVNCQRILRYRVPGLDDAEWIRQDEPREILDVEAWRKLLMERFQNL